MAIQTYITYKALTYGQVAERYGFSLKDNDLKDVYMPWNPANTETYPFNKINGLDHGIADWIPPSHTQSRDLVTEDFEHKYDYVAIKVPEKSKNLNTTRTFNAYLVHSSYYAQFKTNFGNISTDDLHKLRISISTNDFNEHFLTLSKMYWYKNGVVERVYAKCNSYTTMYVVSVDGSFTTTTNQLSQYMKKQNDLGFGDNYSKFFTHSYQALS